MLLKEVAYKWGKQHLLQIYELVLLVCLHNPFLEQVKSVSDLFQFCMGDQNATEIVSPCAQYFLDRGGKNLILLLDGYDKHPEHLQESSLITNILKHTSLWIDCIILSTCFKYR